MFDFLKPYSDRSLFFFVRNTELWRWRFSFRLGEGKFTVRSVASGLACRDLAFFFSPLSLSLPLGSQHPRVVIPNFECYMTTLKPAIDGDLSHLSTTPTHPLSNRDDSLHLISPFFFYFFTLIAAHSNPIVSYISFSFSSIAKLHSTPTAVPVHRTIRGLRPWQAPNRHLPTPEWDRVEDDQRWGWRPEPGALVDLIQPAYGVG